MANSFINKKADLTTTDLTTLYTVPSFKTAVVKSLIVSEDAGSGSTITITLVNSSGAIFNLFKDKAIASKATTELLSQPLVMEESEVLNKVWARRDRNVGLRERAENRFFILNL